MSKACAKCERAVYPLEELKCLDKVWHKACFKCQECGMTLSMRNYKGFNRLPYCTAHCPQAKHTTVADTPEIRRIQENTKIQSTVKYHEEFEKQKGKVTQIADDPETLRIKQNTRIISNVAYHGELERKAAMEQKRPMAEGFEDSSTEQPYSDEEVKAPPTPNPIPEIQPVVATNQGYVGPPRNQAVRMVEEQQSQHAKDSPYSSRQASTVIYTSEHGAAAANNIYWGHGSTVVYCSDFGPVTNPASRKVGSIADYDPVNDNFGSLGMPSQANYRMGDPRAIQQQLQQQQQQQQLQQQQQQQQQLPPQQPPPSSGLKYRAMYDYTAADSDEVSFLDGDIIVNCTPVDEGWMTGMVQRTGRRGMLPANYVELAN